MGRPQSVSKAKPPRRMTWVDFKKTMRLIGILWMPFVVIAFVVWVAGQFGGKATTALSPAATERAPAESRAAVAPMPRAAAAPPPASPWATKLAPFLTGRTTPKVREKGETHVFYDGSGITGIDATLSAMRKKPTARAVTFSPPDGKPWDGSEFGTADILCRGTPRGIPGQRPYVENVYRVLGGPLKDAVFVLQSFPSGDQQVRLANAEYAAVGTDIVMSVCLARQR